MPIFRNFADKVNLQSRLTPPRRAAEEFKQGILGQVYHDFGPKDLS